MSVEIALLIAFITLLGNAFFVGAEFGLVSARRSSIELEALNGSRPAKITLGAMEHVSLMLAGAQLGVTLCSLVFGAVSEPMVAHLLEGSLENLGISGFWIETISIIIALHIMVYLHVVIGEMVPKNLALAAPSKVALLLTPLLVFFVKINKPIILALNSMANGSLRFAGFHPSNEMVSSFSRDEVAGFVKESHKEGLLSLEEEQLLTGALQFDADKVRSVLIPLSEVKSATGKPTPADIENLSAKTGFSRFPVIDSKGQYKGYIHLKDILQIEESEHYEPLPAKLIRPLATVKTTSLLRDALTIMQHSGAHLAKVADSTEEQVGIIALEDVLEMLVGEILDDTQKA